MKNKITNTADMDTIIVQVLEDPYGLDNFREGFTIGLKLENGDEFILENNTDEGAVYMDIPKDCYRVIGKATITPKNKTND